MLKYKFIDNFFFILILCILPAQILGSAIPDIIITLFSLYYLIIFLLYQKNKTSIFLNEKWLIFGIIYCLGAIIVSVISDYNINALKSSIPYFRFLIFAYLLSFYFLNDSKKFSILIIVISITIFFVSLDICLQYFLGKDIFGYLSTVYRNAGPFGDELKGGSFIAKYFTICLTSLIIFFLKYKKNYSKMFLFIFVCFFGVLLSGERAATIHITLSLIVFILIFISTLIRFKKSIIVIIFSFIVFFTYFISEDFKKRYYNAIVEISSIQNIKDSHYGAHYLTAYSIFLDHPISGIGQNNYRNKCSDEKYDNLNSKKIKDRCSTHPHIYYIQILSDLGIINFLFFILMIFFIFKKTFIANNSNKLIMIGKIVSLSIVFLPFLPTGSFYNNWSSSLNWLIIAICISSSKKNYFYFFSNFLKKKSDPK